MLSELVDKHQYFEKRKSFKSFQDLEGNWFYLTVESVFERTALSEKEQRASIKKLVSLGILEQTRKGLPAVRYFKINIENLENFLGLNEEGKKAKLSEIRQKAKLYPAKSQCSPYILKRTLVKNPTTTSQSHEIQEPSFSTSVSDSSSNFFIENFGKQTYTNLSRSLDKKSFEHVLKYSEVCEVKVNNPFGFFKNVGMNRDQFPIRGKPEDRVRNNLKKAQNLAKSVKKPLIIEVSGKNVIVKEDVSSGSGTRFNFVRELPLDAEDMEKELVRVCNHAIRSISLRERARKNG